MSKRVNNCGKARVRRPSGFTRPQSPTSRVMWKFMKMLDSHINEGQEDARRNERSAAIKRRDRLARNPGATYLHA